MTGIYRGWAQFLTKVLSNFLNKQKYAMYTATANMEAAAVANISNNVPFHGCRQVKTVRILYYGTVVFQSEVYGPLITNSTNFIYTISINSICHFNIGAKNANILHLYINSIFSQQHRSVFDIILWEQFAKWKVFYYF